MNTHIEHFKKIRRLKKEIGLVRLRPEKMGIPPILAERAKMEGIRYKWAYCMGRAGDLASGQTHMPLSDEYIRAYTADELIESARYCMGGRVNGRKHA